MGRCHSLMPSAVHLAACLFIVAAAALSPSAAPTKLRGALWPQHLPLPRRSAAAPARPRGSLSPQHLPQPRHDPIAMCDAADSAMLESCRAMRANEITAELDLRGINYDDCFENEELAQRLATARQAGRADPNILKRFNEESARRAWEADAEDEAADTPIAADDVAAGDGSLPGGMTPEQLQRMSSTPELMALLRNPKMQQVMSEVMQRGEAGLSKYADDPEVADMLRRFKELSK